MIIAFGHRKQQGKSTCAELLKQNIIVAQGLESVEIRAFSDPLYEICHQLYGWDGFKKREHYEAFPSDKEVPLPVIGKSPRQILIDFGTLGIRQQVYSETWVKYLINTLNNKITLIPDLRFHNEAEALKEAGALLVKVVRPKAILENDVADEDLDDFEGWDLTIINDGTKRQLNDQLMEEVFPEIANQ